MIPLYCISQEKYIIKNDTIIGYTLNENRTIALLFLEGDKYKELYFNNEDIIKLKDSLIYTKDYHIKFQDSIIITSNTYMENLNNDNIKLNDNINIEKKKSNRNAIIAGSSGVLNIILIIILCLI